MSDPLKEPIEETSADLPYELQFRMFEQLTTLGTAGAGLTITLLGSILRGSGFEAWLAAIWFALAAILALVAQMNLTEGLFQRTPVRQKNRIMALTSVGLIGMGIGSLGTSVALG
jgi:hypothetical protein